MTPGASGHAGDGAGAGRMFARLMTVQGGMQFGVLVQGAVGGESDGAGEIDGWMLVGALFGGGGLLEVLACNQLHVFFATWGLYWCSFLSFFCEMAHVKCPRV